MLILCLLWWSGPPEVPFCRGYATDMNMDNGRDPQEGRATSVTLGGALIPRSKSLVTRTARSQESAVTDAGSPGWRREMGFLMCGWLPYTM